MFEKAKPVSAPPSAPGAAPRPEERPVLRSVTPTAADARFAGRPARRAGEALRAVEWGELTARLNAARDLRLLLRTETRAPIEAVAASFGDAAASYFALLDEEEPAVNSDALGRSKVSGAMLGPNAANRPGDASGPRSGASRGDARDIR